MRLRVRDGHGERRSVPGAIDIDIKVTREYAFCQLHERSDGIDTTVINARCIVSRFRKSPLKGGKTLNTM